MDTAVGAGHPLQLLGTDSSTSIENGDNETATSERREVITLLRLQANP